MTTDMKFLPSTQRFRIMSVLSACSISILLAACGGGGGADGTAAVAVADNNNLPVGSTSNPGAPPVVKPPVVTPPVTVPPVVTPPASTADKVITSVNVQSTDTVSTRTQTNVPFTFGQIFVPGDLLNGNSLYGKLANGTIVPLQVDVKAKHADGSVRHAIISASLVSLPYNQAQKITLVRSASATAAAVGTTPAALLAAGFTAGVNITLNGQVYTASADSLLKAGKITTWLAGPLVNEWQVSAPLKDVQGVAHPHLTARFAIRSYTALNKARVDVTLENDWAYEPNPQDFTYDAKIFVGGQTAYSKPALAHYSHARWRKVFWWGAAPSTNVQQDITYLIASKAVPNYDQSFSISPTTINTLGAQFSGAVTEPMAVGLAVPYMPTTGGRPDIGILPGWAASYLLSMDKTARDATLGTADLAGSWSMHYRDKNTDRPLSIVDYPYATTNTRAPSFNPVTQKNEAVVIPVTANPSASDSAHTPGFAYLPYLLTGDFYYLEELQFWAMGTLVDGNPGYRQQGLGLVNSDQVRGQAWSMRNMGEAAYITPDSDTLKSQLTSFVNNNLDWYNSTYTNNASANALGVLVNGYALSYNDGRGIAPWQDDFFTSVVGHLAELGFAKASPLLGWKAKFVVSRMISPDFCWIDGSIYAINITDTPNGPTFYRSIGDAYRATELPSLTSLACNSQAMASLLNVTLGEMVGYSDYTAGYPSNMQPALAYSTASGYAGAANAWKLFMTRSVKPDYSTGPQFAIVPR